MATQKRQNTESASTRQKIIDSARAEFARLGLAGARIDRIARTAGVNKAMIYYHFDSKDALYLEVIGSFYVEVAELMRTETGTDQTIEELLIAMASIWTKLFRRIPDIRPILMREIAEPREEVVERVTEILTSSELPRRFMHALTATDGGRSFRPIDVRQALISFVTMNVGYHLLSPLIHRAFGVGEPERFAKEREHAVVDLFLNGAKAR